MTRRWPLRGAIAVLAIGGGISLASPASSVPVSLSVSIDGQQASSYDASALNCSAGDVVSHCVGGGLVIGDLRLDSWDLTFDNDPVVSGPVVVTNLSLISQQFTFLFTLPVAPIGPSTVIGGSVQGGMTDNTGDGVTVSTAAGSALYSALIDGGTVQTLYADPQSFSAGAFLSGNIANLAFGTPIPSLGGSPVAASIGIKIDFVLTPGDSASFTSNFVVQPIPEPATAALFALGLGGLAAAGRKRRSAH
jgi:PEP-CTERM motif